ncbi:MAG: HipA domain-containing protein [Saprospiraceae bacterium]
MSKSLKFVPYENHSGFDPDLRTHLPTLPKRYTLILDEAISGEAPKDFIRVYDYERGSRKKNPKTWIPYIAKVARKWYPNESITEHLLNRLGYTLGVNVANSKLVMDDEFWRLRFLSEYFLRSGERLEHGQEIFSGYVSDPQLVEEIEKDRKTARNFFTFQFSVSALKHRFGHGVEGQKIISDFVKMLCFDAVTGNNDRHTYNWGIICDLSSKRAPRFSPIYDSARGLFWNEHEDRLSRFKDKQKDGTTNLEKYIRDSMPRIGWEGKQDPNHFELAGLIYQNCPEHRYIFDEVISSDFENAANELLEKEFEKLYSPKRYELIKKCLNLRFQILTHTIHQSKKEERT